MSAPNLGHFAVRLVELDQSQDGDWFWPYGPGLSVLEPVASMPAGDVAQLIGLVARLMHRSAARPSMALMEKLAEALPDDALPSVCAAWLDAVIRPGPARSEQTGRMVRAYLASGERRRRTSSR